MSSKCAGLVLLLLCGAAHADLEHRIGVAFGADASLTPSLGGFGFGILDYKLANLRGGMVLHVNLNSDTLHLSLERIPIKKNVEAGIFVGGEAFYAGILPRYARDGVFDDARGFWASYVDFGAWLKVNEKPSYLELAATGRRWFFSPTGSTSSALVLPPEMMVGELRIRYTYWRLRPDPSLYEAHRLFPRAVGVALGIELGLDVRESDAAWGALDPTKFSPVDLRNTPSRAPLGARQWMIVGVQLSQKLRLQIQESAAILSGTDDLARLRVGGSNPWVVPVIGYAWASVLASDVAALQISLHGKVFAARGFDVEVGGLVDAVVTDDVHRTGSFTQQPGALVGVGAFVDARLRTWQLDVRTGYAPPTGPLANTSGGYSVLVAAGFGWRK
jgi:hypothetical protein